MGNQELGIQVTADLMDALSSLQDLLEKILDIPDSKDTNLNVDVNGEEEIGSLKDNLDAISDKDVNINTDLTGDATERIQDMAADATELDGKAISMDAEVTGDASEKMGDLEEQADDLDGREITIDTGTTSENVDDADESVTTLSSDTDTATDSTTSFARGLGNLLAPLTGLKASSDSLDFSKSLEQTTIWYHMSGDAAKDYTSKMQSVIDANHNASISANDIAGGFKELASLGVDSNSALSEMPELVSMATRNSMDLNTVVDKGTSILRSWGLSGDAANTALSELNYTAQTFGEQAPEYISAFQRMSQAMSGWDINPDQLMGITEAMKNGGASVNQLSRAFRNTASMNEFKKNMDDAANGTGDAKDAMDQLGVSVVRNADGTVDYGQTMVAISDALGNVQDDTERTQLATEIFGSSVGNVFGKIKGEPSQYTQEIESNSEEQSKALGKSASEHKDILSRIKVYWDDFISWLGGQSVAVQLAVGGLGIFMGGTVLAQIIEFMQHPITKTKELIQTLKELPDTVRDVVTRVKSTLAGDDIAKAIQRDVRPDLISKDAQQAVDDASRDIVKTTQDTVDKIKGKVGELKESNVGKILFGDEKGTINVEGASSKINGFVDDTKIKIGELDNYDVYDRIFKDTGQGDKAVSKIGTLVGQIESKLSKLDKYSPTAKVTPTNANTETPTPTAGEGEPREGTSILDRIKGSFGKIPSGGELVDGLLNGLYTSAKLGSGKAVGYSLGTTLFDMLNMGAADSGVFLGMDLPGNPLYNLENNQPMIDWDPINQMKKDAANATNKNVPGSLADQLNFPGWLKGQGVDLQSSYKMPDWSSLSSGFNTAKSTIQSGWNQLSSFVTSHIPKINWNTIFQGGTGAINTVKNAWNSFGQWVTSHVPKVNWSSIQQGLQGAVNGVKTQWNNFTSWIPSHLPKINIHWPDIQVGLQGAVNGVKTQWNNFTSWIPSHLPKINIHWPDIQVGLQGAVQWVQGQWNGFTGWLSSHVPKVPTPNWPDVGKGLGGAVQWVKTEWNNFMGWLGTLPAKMQSYGGQIVHGLEQGILNGIPGLRSALSVIQGMTETNSPPKEGPLSGVSAGNWANWGSQLINGFSSGISSGQGIMNSALAGIESITSGFLGNMTSVASNLFSTGVSMVNNLASGLSAGVPDLSAVFSQISNMFPHSPPKTGPLSEIKAENMKSWTQSIALSGVEGLSQFTNYMGSMIKVPNLPTIRSPAALNSTADKNSGSGITVVVQSGAVQINGNASKDVVTNAGTYLGDGIAASNLSRQANNRGLSVINVIR